MLCSDWLVVIRGGGTPIFMKDRGLVQELSQKRAHYNCCL